MWKPILTKYYRPTQTRATWLTREHAHTKECSGPIVLQCKARGHKDNRRSMFTNTNNNHSSSVKFNFDRRKIITTREQAHHQERQNERRTLLNCLPAASLSIHYSIDWPNKGNEDCHTSPKINGNINGAVKMPRSPFVALIRKCFMIYGHCNNQRHTTTTITYLLPATA